MAWSYSANPGGVPADLVRLLLGDTDGASPLCEDTEVAFALADQGNDAYLAAAWLADRVAAKLAQDETISLGGVSISPTRTAERFTALATRLRTEAANRPKVLPPGAAGGVAIVTGAAQSVSSFTREDPVEGALRGYW